MDIFLVGAALALAYLVGSVPFAYLVAYRLKGIDIRSVGSGNVGAVNTFRHVGLGAGGFVLVADALKGVMAISLPSLLGAPQWMVYSAAVAVIVGHNWSPFLNFQGGRGVAPVFGLSLAMLPLLTVVAAAPVVVLFLLTHNIVVSAVVGFIVLNVLAMVDAQPGSLIAFCLFLTALVGATHLARSRQYYLRAIRDRRWRSILWID